MARALALVVPAPSLPRDLRDGEVDPVRGGLTSTPVPAGRSVGVESLPRLILRILRGIALAVLALHAWYIVTTSLLIFIYKFCDPPATVIMPYRAILYRWKLVAPKPLPLKKIPPYIRSMLVSVEDGKFYTHHGLDFEAFKRARQINATVGKPLYGGSTLTMQVARTLFLVPEKSYIRKYFEIIAALELEVILGKDRILEFYFDYAEWGKGIFGIESASRSYFGKSVSSLSRDEAARLVALLSSPIKYNTGNLQRSPILRERYAYLSRRYGSGTPRIPDSTPQLQPPPQGIEPSVLDAEVADPAVPEEAGDASGGDAASGGELDSAGAAENPAGADLVNPPIPESPAAPEPARP